MKKSKNSKPAFNYTVEYEKAPKLNGILTANAGNNTKAVKEMLAERFPTAKKITVGKVKPEKIKAIWPDL